MCGGKDGTEIKFFVHNEYICDDDGGEREEDLSYYLIFKDMDFVDQQIMYYFIIVNGGGVNKF